MSNENVEWNANSALYNAVDKSIFVRNKLAHQVSYLFPDKNGLNLTIHNESRLRKNLFKEIQRMFNTRIKHYKMEGYYGMMHKSNEDDFRILKFILNHEYMPSGKYRVYPKTFVCSECKEYVVFNNESEFANFNLNKCRNPNCSGSYSQISIMAFCEQCGKIDNIVKSCPQCKDYKHLELHRENQDFPSTWFFKCKKCGTEIDFMPYPCNHKVTHGGEVKRSEAPPTKQNFLNVKQGGVYKSVVMTTVDVPKKDNSEYIDEIYLATYLKRWDGVGYLKDKSDIKKIELINKFLNIIKRFPTEEEQEEAIEECLVSEMGIERGKYLENILKDINEEFANISVSFINDYLILKGIFSNNEDLVTKSDLDVFNELGIDEVTYIPEIQLISSSIGTINGINKFYESGFVPHFEPHRGYDRLNKKPYYKIYSYPFETEGIMIDLDKVKLVNWLIKNSKNQNDLVTREEDAKKFLFNLDESSEEYDKLKTLIHTYSHILLKRAPAYTGLDEGSCKELLFPKSGAFLLYSSSNINIGGFSFVFENALTELLKDIKLDINDCIFDPNCLHEKGACFSCLYVPEFVCTEFNKNLDRDVFLGQERFEFSFLD